MPALLQALRMHSGVQACLLQMQIDDIGYQHPMSFNRSLMPKGRIFLGTAPLGMCPIVALKMCGCRARMPIILPGGDQKVQMGLPTCSLQRLEIMEGIGDWQALAGNRVYEVTHESHVLAS
jgi:hypothetical protein